MSNLNGTVFSDFNLNGVFDPGVDTTQANVIVFLDPNGNGIVDATERTALTDANGFYQIGNVPAGTYNLRQIVPPGFTQSTPAAPITLTGAATENVTFNFANVGAAVSPVVPGPVFTTGNISGVVFVDNNLIGQAEFIVDEDGNLIPDLTTVNQLGLLYDPFTDATLSGIPVYIDLNNDGFLNANEPLTFTNDAGFYDFTVLQTGSYVLRIADAFEVTGENSILGSLQQTTPSPDIVDVFAGTTTFNDFGVVVPNSIYGKVINDLNGNGFPEATEPGIQGIPVFIDANGNGVFDLGEKTTTSGADGAYLLSGLNTNIGEQDNELLAQNPFYAYQLLVDPLSVANSFDVAALAPSTGYIQTSPLPGPSIDVPVVPSGSAQANFLYAFAPTASVALPDSITGFVFNDLNADGIVQAGETNIPGVNVYIDLDNNGTLDDGEPVSVTDARGTFGFLNVFTPNDYVVRVDDEFLTTPVPNVTLGTGQAAQLAIGLSTFEPTIPINEDQLVVVPGFNPGAFPVTPVV